MRTQKDVFVAHLVRKMAAFEYFLEKRFHFL